MALGDVLASSPDPTAGSFMDVVEEICAANEKLLRGRAQRGGRHALPSRAAVANVVEDLRAVLFPGHFGATDLAPANIRYYVGAQLDRLQITLREQIRRGLSLSCRHQGLGAAGDCRACDADATDATEDLVRRLPGIRRMLEDDLQAAYASDPAATVLDETLYCYPGILAVTHHRIAHELYLRAVPLIPRMISELAHAATGIDIHPGARIGSHFFIDHGTGVVIGETCQIGSRVRLYQGVTLGARRSPVDPDGILIRGQPRHPIIGDEVIIYAGATILGRINIGRGAVIGGNVWLTRDVAPGTKVIQALLQQDAFEEGAGI